MTHGCDPVIPATPVSPGLARKQRLRTRGPAAEQRYWCGRAIWAQPSLREGRPRREDLARLEEARAANRGAGRADWRTLAGGHHGGLSAGAAEGGFRGWRRRWRSCALCSRCCDRCRSASSASKRQATPWSFSPCSREPSVRGPCSRRGE